MPPSPVYLGILDIGFAWHGIPVPATVRSALPPVVRITVAMLLRAIVDARLAVYETQTNVSMASDTPRAGNAAMEEVEGIPGALAEMSASGGYDPKVLAHYRLCMDELYVWAIGEDLDPPACCVPSWVCKRPAARAELRRLRPEMDDKRMCQTIAQRRWSEDDRVGVAAMARDHEIQVAGNGRLYRQATVRRWLYEVAPQTARKRADCRRPATPREVSSARR